jgi:hypothetical protein
MKQISVYRHNTKTVQFYHSDKFEFRKDRPHHWLQKSCLFILKKLSCFYLDEKETVTRIDIDQEQVIKCVHEQVISLNRDNRTPKKVYMGRDDFERCTRQVMQSRDRYRFQADFVYAIDRERKILGLDVETIPYMNGVLVI